MDVSMVKFLGAPQCFQKALGLACFEAILKTKRSVFELLSRRPQLMKIARRVRLAIRCATCDMTY